MSIKTNHYRIVTARDLADWLETQCPDAWWSVDGDITLMEKISFPCLSRTLAAMLRKIDKPLLAEDPAKKASGEPAGKNEVGELAVTDEWGDRVFHLSWADDPHGENDWLLMEDKDIQQIYADSEKNEG